MDTIIFDRIEKLLINVKEVFKSSKFSENYKQKLIFGLLNAIRSKNRHKFTQYLIHAMASAVKENQEAVRKVAEDLLDLMDEKNISDELWSRIGFAIILGIMASESNKS